MEGEKIRELQTGYQRKRNQGEKTFKYHRSIKEGKGEKLLVDNEEKEKRMSETNTP